MTTATRPITPEDMADFTRLSDVQISPDGALVAFVAGEQFKVDSASAQEPDLGCADATAAKRARSPAARAPTIRRAGRRMAARWRFSPTGWRMAGRRSTCSDRDWRRGAPADRPAGRDQRAGVVARRHAAGLSADRSRDRGRTAPQAGQRRRDRGRAQPQVAACLDCGCRQRRDAPDHQRRRAGLGVQLGARWRVCAAGWPGAIRVVVVRGAAGAGGRRWRRAGDDLQPCPRSSSPARASRPTARSWRFSPASGAIAASTAAMCLS